jgi:hypothetical protein
MAPPGEGTSSLVGISAGLGVLRISTQSVPFFCERRRRPPRAHRDQADIPVRSAGFAHRSCASGRDNAAKEGIAIRRVPHRTRAAVLACMEGATIALRASSPVDEPTGHRKPTDGGCWHLNTNESDFLTSLSLNRKRHQAPQWAFKLATKAWQASSSLGRACSLQSKKLSISI